MVAFDKQFADLPKPSDVLDVFVTSIAFDERKHSILLDYGQGMRQTTAVSVLVSVGAYAWCRPDDEVV